jgi:hypothetical protein
MLGSFTFLYKYILNALPLIPLPDQLSILRSVRQNRLRKRELDLESGSSLPSPPGTGLSTGQQTPLMMHSRSAEKRLMDEKSKQETEGRRGSRLSMQSQVLYSRLDSARWHAVVAGAIAGLSVLWEKKTRRITIAQQVFVRCVIFPPLGHCFRICYRLTGAHIILVVEGYKDLGMRGALG